MTKLSKGDIRLTVARYVVFHSEDLKGCLAEAGNFLIGGESTSEFEVAPLNLKRGWAVDILADRMEGRGSFAWYVSASPHQATNPNIFKLTRTHLGIGGLLDKVNLLGLEMSETEEGLLLRVPVVEEKEYMTPLRRYSEFKKYAEEHDLTWNLHGTQGNQLEVMMRVDSLFYK